ncbi:MAG: hypothetical protein JST00_20725 [Deltaproteobacteria bacterium]|nr:hypothetical protein [Deltaproteobacteria bacterium]
MRAGPAGKLAFGISAVTAAVTFAACGKDDGGTSPGLGGGDAAGILDGSLDVAVTNDATVGPSSDAGPCHVEGERCVGGTKCCAWSAGGRFDEDAGCWRKDGRLLGCTDLSGPDDECSCIPEPLCFLRAHDGGRDIVHAAACTPQIGLVECEEALVAKVFPEGLPRPQCP